MKMVTEVGGCIYFPTFQRSIFFGLEKYTLEIEELC